MSAVFEKWVSVLQILQADPNRPKFWNLPARTRPPHAVAPTPTRVVQPCPRCALADCKCPVGRGRIDGH